MPASAAEKEETERTSFNLRMRLKRFTILTGRTQVLAPAAKHNNGKKASKGRERKGE